MLLLHPWPVFCILDGLHPTCLFTIGEQVGDEKFLDKALCRSSPHLTQAPRSDYDLCHPGRVHTVLDMTWVLQLGLHIELVPWSCLYHPASGVPEFRILQLKNEIDLLTHMRLAVGGRPQSHALGAPSSARLSVSSIHPVRLGQ